MPNIKAKNTETFSQKVIQKYLELACKIQGIGDVINIRELSNVLDEIGTEYPDYQAKIFKTFFGLETGESITDTDKLLQECDLQGGKIRFESKIPETPSFSMDPNVDFIIDIWLRELSNPKYLSRYIEFTC
jgi:hypothetical protein